jgi:hypothetical protein
VTVESILFWDIMAFSLVEVHWYFRETYWFHLQGQRVGQTGSPEEEGGKQSGVTSQKVVLLSFIIWDLNN